ncbi:hypothetical protein HK096_004929 [Nowakowskiella sp. JEL0078]|nr:hypothetical protein HK096_004929 [Nowakowskiella sp. JEL0078]
MGILIVIEHVDSLAVTSAGDVSQTKIFGNRLFLASLELYLHLSGSTLAVSVKPSFFETGRRKFPGKVGVVSALVRFYLGGCELLSVAIHNCTLLQFFFYN